MIVAPNSPRARAQVEHGPADQARHCQRNGNAHEGSNGSVSQRLGGLLERSVDGEKTVARRPHVKRHRHEELRHDDGRRRKRQVDARRIERGAEQTSPSECDQECDARHGGRQDDRQVDDRVEQAPETRLRSREQIRQRRTERDRRAERDGRRACAQPQRLQRLRGCDRCHEGRRVRADCKGDDRDGDERDERACREPREAAAQVRHARQPRRRRADAATLPSESPQIRRRRGSRAPRPRVGPRAADRAPRRATRS